MLALLLTLLSTVAHADPILIPNPCPKCLGVLDVDMVIADPKWKSETSAELEPFGLNSLLVYVKVEQGSIAVTVGDVALNEKNFVGYRGDELVYQIEVPRDEEFKIAVQNVGKIDAGYEITVAGSSLSVDGKCTP